MPRRSRQLRSGVRAGLPGDGHDSDGSLGGLPLAVPHGRRRRRARLTERRHAFDRVDGISDTIGVRQRKARAARVEERCQANSSPGCNPGDDGRTPMAEGLLPVAVLANHDAWTGLPDLEAAAKPSPLAKGSMRTGRLMRDPNDPDAGLAFVIARKARRRPRALSRPRRPTRGRGRRVRPSSRSRRA